MHGKRARGKKVEAAKRTFRNSQHKNVSLPFIVRKYWLITFLDPLLLTLASDVLTVLYNSKMKVVVIATYNVILMGIPMSVDGRADSLNMVANATASLTAPSIK